MPLVNAVPANVGAEAFSRASAVSPTAAGNAAGTLDTPQNTAPAGAGPAAVVNISAAARELGNNVGEPGLNNSQAAAEGGNAAELRNLLSQRYNAQAARLNEPPSQ